MIALSRGPHCLTDSAMAQVRNDGEGHVRSRFLIFGSGGSARRALRRDWMSSLSHAILRLPTMMARRHGLLSRAIATHPRLRAQSATT